MKKLYFSYGSNLSKRRLEERKIKYYILGLGILEDFELKFNKVSKKDPSVGFANIVPKENSIVEGIVYEIEEEDLFILDRFEGFPEHYFRENIVVSLNNNHITCITYIANPLMIKDNLKPTNKYLEYLLEGKEYLTEDYYKFLEDFKNETN